MSPPTFIYRRRISTLHKAYFDGGFWGTPGPMTIKFIVYDAQGHPIQQFWKRLGHGTNKTVLADYPVAVNIRQSQMPSASYVILRKTAAKKQD